MLGDTPLLQKSLMLGIIILFILSTIAPITLGYNVKTKNDVLSIEKEKFNRCLYPDYYDCYNASERFNYKHTIYRNPPNHVNFGIKEVSDIGDSFQPLGAPLDSPWPMYCHDLHHTGRSPCDTLNNSGTMKWSFRTNNYSLYGSSVIDTNGIIYLGSGDFFALYPNGTKKWQYEINGRCESCPSLDENGTIYFGTSIGDPNYFYAIYPNGTIKWRYWIGGGTDIKSSPIIGSDGTIFFGCGQSIVALYSNGTLRWQYSTNHLVYSSPAIGDDGTVYCGCHDTYLYALYPNNGTLKWKFSTGDWIRVCPCIAEDGTIYCVSLDNYLYAVNLNGTMKWRTNVGAGTSPTIGHDGTIYAGWDHLYAVNPTDGSIKWIFNPGSSRCIEGGTPCHSSDGFIYLGTRIQEFKGGEIISINSNGTELWRILIANEEVQSAPAIGEDGTVYIGSSSFDAEHGVDFGYLHAFGPLDPHAPTAPTITGQTNGRIKRTYEYTFTSTSPLGNKLYYLIDWGDGVTTDWLGPYSSGEPIMMKHSWSEQGTYTITARAKDTDNLWGPWGTLSVTMPCSYELPIMNFLDLLLERFPHVFPILRYILGQYKTFF